MHYILLIKKNLKDVLEENTGGYCMYCYSRIRVDGKLFANLEHAIEKSNSEKLIECIPDIGLSCSVCNQTFKRIGEQKRKIQKINIDQYEKASKCSVNLRKQCTASCKALRELQKRYSDLSGAEIILQPMGVKGSDSDKELLLQYNVMKMERYTDMYKILIIEDDAVIAEQVSRYLARWGYETACAEDFENILPQFVSFAPQLVLLDIGLPFYNGYYWCSEIRKVSQVPVVFVSSASDNMNIVMAMNMGGDDFIVKPFDLEVLLAKVQAILRRTYAFQNQSTVMEHRNVILNLADMSLLYQGTKLELSKNEFRILQLLYENAGRTVSRETIMKRLWDNECFVDDNTLTVNMNRLRRKLEEAGIQDFIATKKGVGYQLSDCV